MQNQSLRGAVFADEAHAILGVVEQRYHFSCSRREIDTAVELISDYLQRRQEVIRVSDL